MKKSKKQVKIEVTESNSVKFNDGDWKTLIINLLIINPELSRSVNQILYRTGKCYKFNSSGLFDKFEISNLKPGHYNFVRAELEKLVSDGEIIFNEGD